MTEERRSWVARHPRATVLALVLLLAVLADLGAGWLLIRPNPGSFRCSHPYYHHGFLPGVVTTTRWGEREYPIITNSLGFRDRSPRRIELATSKERIVIIGDSFVEGVGVTYEESFLGQLEQLLDPSTTEVLNAGAVSYCPMIYHLKTRYLLEEVGLRFDRLVVFIDISDIQDEVHYQSFHPRLPGVVDRTAARLRAWLANSSFSYYAVTSYLRRRAGGISTAFDASALADNVVYFQDLEAYQGRENPLSAEEGRWEWTIAQPLMEAWGRQGLELARADMRKLVELCQAHGIGVVLCVYPSPVQIYMNDLESVQVTFWLRFAEENGCKLVNLFPDFVGPEAGRPGAVYRRYFIERDIHWNPAGHRLVAQRLDESL